MLAYPIIDYQNLTRVSKLKIMKLCSDFNKFKTIFDLDVDFYWVYSNTQYKIKNHSIYVFRLFSIPSVLLQSYFFPFFRSTQAYFEVVSFFIFFFYYF